MNNVKEIANKIWVIAGKPNGQAKVHWDIATWVAAELDKCEKELRRTSPEEFPKVKFTNGNRKNSYIVYFDEPATLEFSISKEV